MQRQVDAITSCGVVEQPHEEEDSAGDVDERVDAVRPVHQEGMLEEPPLYIKLVEQVEPLLKVNELEGMSSSDVDGTLDHGHGAESTAELVYL